VTDLIFPSPRRNDAGHTSSRCRTVVRPLQLEDADAWLELRAGIWPHAPAARLRGEIEDLVRDAAQIALGAFDGDVLVGFVELSIHPHAVGCETHPVAYLEAWFVADTHRRRGVGRALVAAGEAWGRSQGCREIASDTWLDSARSHDAHLALGFTETSRLIHYRKQL
jgi:aminoglycoside 6'-N-acetyltransferase I